MLNTHPINRLSKAGAALVNTISSCNNNNNDNCFVSCGFFGSLLSNIFIDDFSAKQYKNCIRMLKGSYILMKSRDKKYKRAFDILPSELARCKVN